MKYNFCLQAISPCKTHKHIMIDKKEKQLLRFQKVADLIFGTGIYMQPSRISTENLLSSIMQHNLFHIKFKEPRRVFAGP